MLTKRDFHLQTGNLGYKTGLSFTNRDFWIINGILGLLFTLWKLLIDKDMSKKDLMKTANISKSTMDKMGRSETVSLEIIDRICNYFNCRIEDVIEHRQRKAGQNEK